MVLPQHQSSTWCTDVTPSILHTFFFGALLPPTGLHQWYSFSDTLLENRAKCWLTALCFWWSWGEITHCPIFSINNWMQHKRMLSLLRLRLQGLSEQCHIFTKNPLNLLNLVSSGLKSFSRGCVWCWWEKRWGHRCQMYRIRDAGVWRLFSSPAVRGVYFWTAVFQVFTLAQNILEMTHYVNSSVCVRSSVTEGCFPSLSVFCGGFFSCISSQRLFLKVITEFLIQTAGQENVFWNEVTNDALVIVHSCFIQNIGKKKNISLRSNPYF